LRNLVLFTAAALVGATSANAQSEIFFNWNTVGWVMGPNGEDKRQTVKGEPSHFKHAGQRWFLVLVHGPAYGWDYHPQLHAVREDGTSVQLTFVDGSVYISPYDALRWAKDDSKIAFSADIYAPDRSYVVTSLIYLANVNFTGGIPELTSDFEPVVAPRGSGGFDLSPDSSQIVYSEWQGVGRNLMIATIGGASKQIMSGDLTSPRWSHNGQRVAFRSENLGFVGTVRPDGSGLVTLAKDTVAKNSDWWGTAAGLRWAPDDSALIYSMDTRKGGWVNRDIFRISASGGKQKNLTSGTNVYLTTVAWRSTINVD
jgi:Tol biopolymer transport system component